MDMQPRGIRISEAHKYLGVGRAVFDREFRPRLQVMDFGHSTKVVDRFELDALFDEYRERNGRPGSSEVSTCQSEQQGYTSGGRETAPTTGGKSTKRSAGSAFDKARARRTMQKRSASSR